MSTTIHFKLENSVPPQLANARKRLGHRMARPISSVRLRKSIFLRRHLRQLVDEQGGSLQLGGDITHLSLKHSSFQRILASNLTALRLVNSKITQPLNPKSFPKLRALYLVGPDTEVSGVGNLATLQHIVRMNSKSIGLPGWANLKKLETLWIETLTVKQDEVSRLTSIRMLRVKLPGAATLPEMKNLTKLYLTCTPKINLQALACCHALTTAAIDVRGAVKSQHIQPFVHPKNLKALFLRGAFTNEGWTVLGALDCGEKPRITRLAIWDTNNQLQPAPIDMRLSHLTLFTGTWGPLWPLALLQSEKLKKSLQSFTFILSAVDPTVLIRFKALRRHQYVDDRTEAVQSFLFPY